jgi:uncharacterized membrane protein YhfC
MRSVKKGKKMAASVVTSAAQSLSFNPGIAVGLAIGALISLLLPIVLAVITNRRTGTSWSVFFWGVLVFFVAQIILRIPWQVPLNSFVVSRAHGSIPILIGWIAVSALTAAIFEEVGRWIGYRFLVREHTWRNGVMFGIGHGGCESILLVGFAILNSLIAYILLTNGGLGGLVPANQLASVEAAYAGLNPFTAALGGIERIFAMATQIALSLIVLQGFIRNERRWLWLAIGYHFATDAIGAGVASWHPYIGEGIIGLFAVVSVWLIVWFYRNAPESASLPNSLSTAVERGSRTE